MIIEQCGTINVKGHSVEREGDHRTKTYELFYGVLNKNALTPFNTSLNPNPNPNPNPNQDGAPARECRGGGHARRGVH